MPEEELLYRKCPDCRGHRFVKVYEQGPNASHSDSCHTCGMWGFVPVPDAVLRPHLGLGDDERSLESAIAHCDNRGWRWQLHQRKSDVGEHLLMVGTVYPSEHCGERFSGRVSPGEALWKAIEMANESEAVASLLNVPAIAGRGEVADGR